MASISNRILLLFRPFLKLSVARSLGVGFAVSIVLGSIGLYILERGNLSYPDAFYLSASAICVTGLVPVPVSSLSVPSQILLMFLIQIGGLGIITFTVFVGVLVIRGLSRNTRIVAFVREAMNWQTDDSKDSQSAKESALEQGSVRRLLLSIINISLTIEGIGAILLYNHFPEQTMIPHSPDRILLSLFTAVSAFNNAGFSITDDLSFLASQPICLVIIEILVVIGGIGFPVIIFIEKLTLELLTRFLSRLEVLFETHMMMYSLKRGGEPSRLYILLTQLSVWAEMRFETYWKELRGASDRIQTNMILFGSLVLIFIGGFVILITEFGNPKTLGNLAIEDKFTNSFFLSISTRTAGFNTFDLAGIKNSTYVLLCSLMFIGGGPQGTAGGIKITTFIILILYLKNVISPQNRVSILGKDVSKNSVAISIRIYFMATTLIVLFLLLQTILNQDHNGIGPVFFEVISAFGTVGLSQGLTPQIGVAEKFAYAVLMYIGRIGPFTLLVALTGHSGLGNMGEVNEKEAKIQVG